MASSPTSTPSRLDLLGVARQLQVAIEQTWPGGAGYDPYDALNSPLLAWLSSRSRWQRIAWTQLLRHLPFNLRPALGIRPHTNSKTISLLARAYLRLAASGGPKAVEDERRARDYLAWLERHATPGYAGAAWGYSFAWQSRRLRLARGEPSAVCTAFVAQAFLDAYAAWRQPRHLAVAASAAQFLLRDCPRHTTPRGVCISYIPSGLLRVHNANVLAAAILAQVSRACGAVDRELREVARLAATYTLNEQREDGAWYYDSPPGGRSALIDGFHSGFVLEALDRIQVALDEDYSAPIGRGLSFYQRRLIAPNGRPLRALGRAGPTDVRDCAQALLVMERFAAAPGAATTRRAVLHWTLDHLRDPRGYFYFHALDALPNRLAYPRWQAWMLLALSPAPGSEGRFAPPVGPTDGLQEGA